MRLVVLLSFLMVMCLILFVGFQSRQLLTVLVCFEGFTLNLLGLLLYVEYMAGFASVIFCFLTLAVCEAAIGLSLLTSFARANGSDYVLSSSEMF